MECLMKRLVNTIKNYTGKIFGLEECIFCKLYKRLKSCINSKKE